MPVYKVIHISKNPLFCEGKKYHDDTALYAVSNYIMADRVNYFVSINGFGVDLRNPALSMDMVAKAYGKDSGLRLRHSVLSFSDNEVSQLASTLEDQLEVIDRIAWFSGEYYGREYQMIYGIHPEKGHIHVHYMMSTLNYNTGLKYDGKKSDYYAYKRFLNDFFQEFFGWYVIFVQDKLID